LARRALFIWRTSGIKVMLRMARNYLVRKRAIKRSHIAGSYVSRHNGFFWDFIKVNKVLYNFTPQKITSERLVINWYIPDFGVSSGGHMTIFRMIHYLEKFGHDVRIYIVGHTNYSSGNEAREVILKNFIDLNASVEIGHEPSRDSDIVIATSWVTAYYVYLINNTKQKYYFVQDYEPAFYAMSSEYIFAEETYKMGYKCITAGPWLTKIMRNRYNNISDYFDLAFDHSVYYPRNVERSKNTIAFYARHVTPRRGVELGILALSIVKELIPDCEIVLFGWNDYHGVPFEYTNGGILNHNQLAELYSRATVGMVFSMTNYSLIPHEMMACKLPVVEIKSECTQEVFKSGEAVLADPDPYSIANEIIHLLRNEEAREQLTERAYRYVQQFDWEKSARKVESILKRS
jgi:Glycosyltransferase